ncbi:MAG TPA: hypothetical protein VMB48_05510 [Steroidobacteraceae bacterium]|nr:hypothetical protein [Steroidobacteraceae bacterium]
MTPWKQELERRLSEPGAPPALPLTALARTAAIARGGAVPDSSLHDWITDAVARQRLAPVIRGLYLNRFTSPPGRLADAVTYLRRDAVVSLHSALDEAGLYNNPPAGVTAMVPLDSGPTRPRVGRIDTQQGPVFIRAMPRRLLEAGDIEDRLDLNRSATHPQATAEKALLDWLYLAISPRSTLAPPAVHDVDVEQLDRARLRRLAARMELQESLKQWLEGDLPARRPRISAA